MGKPPAQVVAAEDIIAPRVRGARQGPLERAILDVVRNGLALLSLLVAVSGCGESCSRKEQARAEPAYLDVRTHGEWRRGHIPGARHESLAELPSRIDYLKDLRDRDLVTVCAGGARAETAAEILRDAGFAHVSVLEGGMRAWTGPLNDRRLDAEGPGYQERFRVGASFVVHEIAEASGPPGLIVEIAYPGAPASQVLHFGDRVTAIDHAALTPERLHDASYASLFPADRSEYTLTANGADVVLHTMDMPSELAKLDPAPEPSLEEMHAWVAGKSTPADAASLKAAFAPHLAAWAPTALPLAAAVLSDPLSGAKLSGRAAAELVVPERPDDVLRAAVLQAGDWLGRPRPEIRKLAAPKSTRDLLEAISILVERLEPPANNLIGGLVPALVGHVFVHDQDNDARIQNLYQLEAHARTRDLSHSLQLAVETASIVSPDWIRSLSMLAPAGRPEGIPPGVTGAVLRAWKTRQGWVVVGDRGANSYSGLFAAIVDLGGDDTYELRSAPRLLIDLGGNDRYRTSGSFGSWPTARIDGDHMSVDVAGNDTYEAEIAGFGAGIIGVSMHVDLAGDDTYSTGSAGLGAGLWGVGVLLDMAGNDRYVGGRLTQGAGGPGGIGKLIDREGNDRYSVMEAKDADFPYAQMSQGCGMGVRELAFGGLGVLVDGAGNDEYTGGEYVQGVGYFGGVGMLVDREGADRYVARKYAQAAGVHAGIGLLDDGGGDDRYELSEQERGQSVAWDMGISVLLDRGGNDRYAAAGLAQAYAAQNGVALLADLAGDDVLTCLRAAECGGVAGPNEYAGGRGAGSVALMYRGR